MPTWDERFREGQYPTDPDPADILREGVDWFPDGRALDVATGTGRNAVFLAARGYEVDAIDQSRAGLEIARENASERGVGANWIQADTREFDYPEDRYDVVTISYFRTLDRLPDVVGALKPGGILFYEHHLRTTDPVDRGPPGDRYRFAANELLRATLDLTVLRYRAGGERRDGRRSAVARVIARNSPGQAQSYPVFEEG